MERVQTVQNQIKRRTTQNSASSPLNSLAESALSNKPFHRQSTAWRFEFMHTMNRNVIVSQRTATEKQQSKIGSMFDIQHSTFKF